MTGSDDCKTPLDSLRLLLSCFLWVCGSFTLFSFSVIGWQHIPVTQKFLTVQTTLTFPYLTGKALLPILEVTYTAHNGEMAHRTQQK